MILWEILRVALASLRAHMLRTILTLFGVILGVTTVVGVVSVISGLNRYVADSFAILTPDVFIISKFGIITSREEFLDAVRRKHLTLEDMEAVERSCVECAMVGGQYDSRKAVSYLDRRLADVTTVGATANVEGIFAMDMETGRWFTQSEYDHGAPVCVIGYDVKDELFPRLDPVGRTIKIDGLALKIVGLRTRQGSIFGESQDKEVDMPLTTFRKAYGGRRSLDIFVRATSPAHVALAEDEVRAILRARRHTPFHARDPFGFVTGESIQTLWRQITITLFAVMVLISGISLVVGGIVIANIMLVSVSERTREIGIRMALGARKKYVLLQFLMEAVLMASVGGAIGIVFGSLIAQAVANMTPIPTRVTPFLVGASLSVAAVVGLLAGVAPSIHAANLEPVDALRSE